MLKNWKIKENIIKVLKTYPVVMSCFFAIGALGIYLVHTDANEDLILKINFSIAVFMGFALILRALQLKYDRYKKSRHYIYVALCLVLSIGYYFTLNPDVGWTITRHSSYYLFKDFCLSRCHSSRMMTEQNTLPIKLPADSSFPVYSTESPMAEWQVSCLHWKNYSAFMLPMKSIRMLLLFWLPPSCLCCGFTDLTIKLNLLNPNCIKCC